MRAPTLLGDHLAERSTARGSGDASPQAAKRQDAQFGPGRPHIPSSASPRGSARRRGAGLGALAQLGERLNRIQ